MSEMDSTWGTVYALERERAMGTDRDTLLAENKALRARVTELEMALQEIGQGCIDPCGYARAVLANAPACPAGGYTGQPSTEEPTAENCIKAGVCGCDVGAA